MRRKDRELLPEKAWEIVDGTSYGVLSLVSPEGLPYGVPVTLWRQENRVYFHCALKGFKTECLGCCPQVSICCVSQAQVVPEATTMHYASAILTGTAREITDPEAKKAAVYAMCRHYQVPESHPAMESGFARCLPATAIWEIEITDITGKART